MNAAVLYRPVRSARKRTSVAVAIGCVATALQLLVPIGSASALSTPSQQVYVGTLGGMYRLGTGRLMTGHVTALAISPDGDTVYAALVSGGNGSVVPFDTATDTAGAAIGVGHGPTAMAMTPDGAAVYVVNATDGPVWVIDPPPPAVTVPIPVGANPAGIATPPDGATAYVPTRGGETVTPIATASNTAGP